MKQSLRDALANMTPKERAVIVETTKRAITAERWLSIAREIESIRTNLLFPGEEETTNSEAELHYLNAISHLELAERTLRLGALANK